MKIFYLILTVFSFFHLNATDYNFSLEGKKVYIPGSAGMVGSALVRQCEKENCIVLKTTRNNLDLKDQKAVEAYFELNKPDVVFLAAAKVGGIGANSTYPADFIFDNLAIELNVIRAAQMFKVQKLVFLGSSCIYPKYAEQPIKEESLLTGPLEQTNAAYAIAKIAGIQMVEACRMQHHVDFISVMPTNLYGPYDTYHVENSHVIPSLILKIHTAKINGEKSVTLWGTGSPMREFMHVDDLAHACILTCKKYSDAKPINIGTGKDLPIFELAEMIKKVVGYEGEIIWDQTKPDGTPKKVLDISRLEALGFSPSISLEEGLTNAYKWFLENRS